MKLPGFDEFLQAINFEALSRDTARLLNEETSKIQNKDDIEEVMKHYSKGMAAGTADFTWKFLLAYHTWLSAQLENLLP